MSALSRTNLITLAKVVTLGLLLGLGIQLLYAWSAPQTGAPNNNVSGPITTTNDPTAYQTRAAGLGLTNSINITNLLGQNNKVTAPKFCLNNDGTDTNCITDWGSMGGSGWTDVPLTGTEDFDEGCEYRALVKPHELQASTGDELYIYMNGVDTKHLVYISHDGQISHIDANSKSMYRVNGVTKANYPTIEKIQERCGGGGGGGQVSWTEVPLTDTSDFDNSCLYRWDINNAGTKYTFLSEFMIPTRISTGMDACHLHVDANNKSKFWIWGSGCTFSTDAVQKMWKMCGGTTNTGTTNPSGVDIVYETCKKENVGVGANSASCTAQCPAGYVAVGGGCDGEGSQNSTPGCGYGRDFTYVSKPTNNNTAWQCGVTLDYACPSSNKTVANGYVSCVKEGSGTASVGGGDNLGDQKARGNAGLNMSNTTIWNLAAPKGDNDAATKGYVDSNIKNGLYGFCMENWGGHQCNSAITPGICTPGVGCSCESGFTKIPTGACNWGDCLNAAWNIEHSEVWFYSCMKGLEV